VNIGECYRTYAIKQHDLTLDEQHTSVIKYVYCRGWLGSRVVSVLDSNAGSNRSRDGVG